MSQSHNTGSGTISAVDIQPGNGTATPPQTEDYLQRGGADIPPHWHPVLDGDWRERLLYEGKKLRKASMENAILFLENKYQSYFGWNEFSDEIYVRCCPPWEDERYFKAHRMEHNDIIRMSALLECEGLGLTSPRTAEAIHTVARKNSFHPAREYFSGLVWDGKSRLHGWLAFYCGSQQNPDYLGRIGTMWMVAAVRRIFEPGTKYDHMLVLEGPQDRGKSTVLRTLATFGKDIPQDYYCDAVKFDDIGEKSTIAIMQGKLIIEFAELDGMSKKEDETLKSWITQQKDEVQKKYENAATTYLRQYVLAGTTNKDTWLRDPTGNRRYHPVRIGDKIEHDHLAADKEQLWAEAVYLHKTGYKIWIANDDPIYHTAKSEQASRITVDIWDETVMEIANELALPTLNNIIAKLIGDVTRRDFQATRRVTNILQLNGWKSGNERHTGKIIKVWRHENTQTKLEI